VIAVKFNEYWFRPRMFGWGWTPTSWEGWGVVLLALAALYLTVENVEGWARYPALIGMVCALVLVSDLKSNPSFILSRKKSAKKKE